MGREIRTLFATTFGAFMLLACHPVDEHAHEEHALPPSENGDVQRERPIEDGMDEALLAEILYPAPQLDPIPVEGSPEADSPEEPAPQEPASPEWTSAPPADNCLSVRVSNTGGVTLNVRVDPNTDEEPVGTLNPGEEVDVISVVDNGQAINGDTRWYRIDAGNLQGFISAYFAACVDPNAAFAGNIFLLPLECGMSATVTQGNNSGFSHNGDYSQHAFDFGLANGTPLVAMRDGVVAYKSVATQPGDPCWEGGGPECINDANYVVIDHGNGRTTQYAHVRRVLVDVGESVVRGQIVAKSGGTGYSTGPHAHIKKQLDCGSWTCHSRPLTFGDVGGNGVPEAGDTVTSENCP
jgi:hypothetical protein